MLYILQISEKKKKFFMTTTTTTTTAAAMGRKKTRDILAWGKREASKPPPLLKYRSSKIFILLTLCVAVFTVSIPNKYKKKVKKLSCLVSWNTHSQPPPPNKKKKNKWRNLSLIFSNFFLGYISLCHRELWAATRGLGPYFLKNS